MPRNISFALTTKQFLDGTKDVTRRIGWSRLTAGDVLCAVEKGMGLKKGEKIKRLGYIKIKDVRRERLNTMLVNKEYGDDECRREGFPNMDAAEFVDFFCRSHSGCDLDSFVNRIEFERISEAQG